MLTLRSLCVLCDMQGWRKLSVYSCYPFLYNNCSFLIFFFFVASVDKYIDRFLKPADYIVGEVVPPERLHPDTFKGSNSRFRKPKGHVVARDRQNKPRTAAQQRATLSRLRSRKKKSLTRLAEMGINYKLPGLDNNA